MLPSNLRPVYDFRGYAESGSVKGLQQARSVERNCAITQLTIVVFVPTPTPVPQDSQGYYFGPAAIAIGVGHPKQHRHPGRIAVVPSPSLPIII